MAGRRPKPPHLHVLHGNPGKRLRHGEARKRKAEAATPEIGLPTKPGHLTPRASKAWDVLVPMLEKMGVLAKVNGMALELLCDAYGEFRQAREVVEVQGHTYESISLLGVKMVRLRPEARVASDAWRRVKQMLTEFGITPASLARVGKVQSEQKDLFELFLMKGGKSGGQSHA